MDQDPRISEIVGAGQKLGAEITQEFILVGGHPMAALTIKSKDVTLHQDINLDSMINKLEAEDAHLKERSAEIKGKIKELKRLKPKEPKAK